MVANITLDRLEDQIKWYSLNSKWNQNRFKWLKVIEVVAAALVPFFAGWFQSNWISYRSTAETLKHEKYLWYAGGGPYLSAKNPEALLSERIEELVSIEPAKWTSEMEQTVRVKASAGKQ